MTLKFFALFDIQLLMGIINAIPIHKEQTIFALYVLDFDQRSSSKHPIHKEQIKTQPMSTLEFITDFGCLGDQRLLIITESTW